MTPPDLALRVGRGAHADASPLPKPDVHRSTRALLGRPGVAAALVWLVAACGGGGEDATGEEGGGSGDEDSPQPVEVMEVRARTLEETVRGIGTLQARETVRVSPEASGRLVEVAYEEGSRVESGQLLFQLDTLTLERELEAARASLEGAEVRRDHAETRHERQKRLHERDVVPDAELDDARAALDEARADVRRLRAEIALVEQRIEDRRVRAPMSGRLTEASVDPGDFVQVGQTLATLYRTGSLEVVFDVPERFAGRLEQGQAVRVVSAAAPDRSFRGQLTYVAPAVDVGQRNLRVKAVLDPDGHLRPGASATARVTVAHRRDRPVIPEESLVGTREGYIVYVVEDGEAVEREVSVGLREPGLVEVRDGVETGDRVVRHGHMRLSDGTPVEVVDTADQRLGRAEGRGPVEDSGSASSPRDPDEARETEASDDGSEEGDPAGDDGEKAP